MLSVVYITDIMFISKLELSRCRQPAGYNFNISSRQFQALSINGKKVPLCQNSRVSWASNCWSFCLCIEDVGSGIWESEVISCALGLSHFLQVFGLR
jgi:hypothetical protein